MIFVGVDWAEAHHDVHVADVEGKRLAKARLPEGVEGIARFHELVNTHAEDLPMWWSVSRPTGAFSSPPWWPRAISSSP